MANLLLFKEIAKEDLSLIKEIYNYFVLNSVATFHTEPLTEMDIAEFLPIEHSRFKSYLIQHKNEFAGYCYLAPYKPRSAYNRTAEVTIYLKPEYFGKGLGTKALMMLEEIAKEKEFKVLLAIITYENETSVKLFEKLGYEKSAHFKQVGEKFEKVLDVVGYQKILS